MHFPTITPLHFNIITATRLIPLTFPLTIYKQEIVSSDCKCVFLRMPGAELDLSFKV